METLRRPRVLVAAVVVVAVLIIGVLAVKSRGSDDKTLDTTTVAANCPPLARDDAAATKPDTPISVDVLANDSDPDGDPLVFQILKTLGGIAAVDDGGTPTDSGDDRLLFTPSAPPVDTATVQYQALDPQGAFATATLSIFVNPTATLPPGVQSEGASDPVPEGTANRHCEAPTSSTVVDDATTGTVGPDTSGATTTITTTVDSGASTGVTTSPRRTTTTKKPATKATTTTAKRSTTTVDNTPGPTNPPPQPTTTRRPTTTAPHTTSPPPPDCGPPQNTDAYRECVRSHSGPTTTAKP